MIDYPLGVHGKWGEGPKDHQARSQERHHDPRNWESNNAIDIVVPKGTPVYAVEDGVIGGPRQFGTPPGAGRDSQLQGLRLHLHTAGNEYYYAHLSEFVPGIGPDVHVHQGDLLGYSGKAGNVEHLHFAARHGDPTIILRNAREHADHEVRNAREHTGPEGPKQAPPADAGEKQTPPEALQSIQPPEVNQSVAPPKVNQSIQPPEVNQSIQSPEVNQSVAPPELNQSVQTPELNQPIPMSSLGKPYEHSNTTESNAPVDSDNVNTPGMPNAGPEYQGNVDMGIPQTDAANQPDMNVNIPIGPISIDPGSKGPISFEPCQINPGQSDEPNASFEPEPPDMGALEPTPELDYWPDKSLDNRIYDVTSLGNEGLGPIPIGIGGVESAAEGTLEPLGHEIVAIAIEKVVEDGVEAYKTWSENQSENEPEIFPNAISFDPGMSYDPGPISDPDMPIELFSTSEPGNTSEPSTSVAARDAYTSGTPDAGPEYQENSDAGVPDSNNFDGGDVDANAPAVEQPFDPNMSIDPGQYASTDSTRSYDNNPSMDIPGELNQSIAPPESNQSVAPPELKQGSIPPEMNQSIQPPEVNQSVAAPELNQSIQPPEVNQSLAPPDSGYDTGSSSTEGYDSRSSDAGGYDGAYPNASGYDSGASDAGGYDAGSSDAKGASEGSGEADPNRG